MRHLSKPSPGTDEGKPQDGAQEMQLEASAKDRDYLEFDLYGPGLYKGIKHEHMGDS